MEKKKMIMTEICTVTFIKSINLNHKLNIDISVTTHYLMTLMKASNTYTLYNIIKNRIR
jgi:hypothetical protein